MSWFPFLPSFFLPLLIMSCVILPMSFVGKGLYSSGDWLYSLQTLSPEVLRGFLQSEGKFQEICVLTTVSRHRHYHFPTEMTDMTLGVIVHWLGTQTGPAATARLAWFLVHQTSRIVSTKFSEQRIMYT